MRRVLVAGATGFIARSLVPALAGQCRVRAASRRCAELVFGADVERVASPPLGTGEPWGAALEDVDAVIHLAALAHVPTGKDVDAERRIRVVNEIGAVALAREAAAAGVRRFVFLSSVRVHGARTIGAPLTESSPLAAGDPYGRSKAEAELGLAQLALSTQLEPVVLRPPLVYGAEARGNFARLVKLVARGIPLPLGAVRNRHSLVWSMNSAGDRPGEILVKGGHENGPDPEGLDRLQPLLQGLDHGDPPAIQDFFRMGGEGQDNGDQIPFPGALD